jgi:hypothetical protein
MEESRGLCVFSSSCYYLGNIKRVDPAYIGRSVILQALLLDILQHLAVLDISCGIPYFSIVEREFNVSAIFFKNTSI